jgi:DNA-binding NarL/FixJ family response regulator
VPARMSDEDQSEPRQPHPASAVRVLAVDDHQAFREALEDLVAAAPDFVLVGQASSGEDAVRDVERLSPQLVVMDVAMPGMGGIAAARTILRRFSEVMILLISVDDPARHLRPEDRSERIACLEKQALSANQLSSAWGTLSSGRPG